MDGKELEYIERLVSCGFAWDYALRVCEYHHKVGGESGVDDYVRFVENVMNDRREYPKEV